MSGMLRVIICILLLGFSGNLFAENEKLQQDRKLIKGTLANGLTYYIYPNDYPKGEAVYRLFIKSGSVYEEDSQQGLAHFLEHMAFNGTTHFPGDGIIRFLESKGASFGKDLNAHTSFNETVYKLQLPTGLAGIIDTTLTILADWAGGLLLDSMEVERERGVILSEWLSKQGPQYNAQQAFLMELLNDSRYSERLVIGDTAVIKYCPRQAIREYYRKWYRPDLMAVAVTGDVDAGQVEKMIRSKFAYLRSSSDSQAPVYSIPDYGKAMVKTVIHESLDKVELNMMQLLPAFPPVRNEKDYEAYLMRIFLNRLMKARLDQLSFQQPSYTKASVGLSEFLNVKGLLLASVELVPEKIDSGILAFSRNLERMYRYGFTSLEIDKEKIKYINQIRRKAAGKSPVSSTSYMNEIYADFYAGNAMVSAEEEYRLLQKYTGKVDSVALVGLLKQTIKPEHTHYLITAFDKVSGQLPSGKDLLQVFDQVRKSRLSPYHQQLDVPETLLPQEPLTGNVINREPIPEIDGQRIHLSNGAQIIFKRSPSDKNKISLTGFRKGGLYALDSTDYVSGLYAGSIVSLSGAGDFSREALSYYLAGNTASMRLLIDKTRSGIVGGCDFEDKETLFQLLYLKWMYPCVHAAVFEQARTEAIEKYLTANRTEEELYYRELGWLLQGKDYTNRELTDTILRNELIRERLLPVFDNCFGSASGYTFVIVGDCNFEDLEELVLMYIGGLPGKQVQTSYRYTGGTILKQQFVFEEAAGISPKAKVSLIFQDDTLYPDFRIFSLEGDLMKAIVRTKLLKKLREELGMVYSVSVSASATLHPAPLSRKTIAFVTAPEQVELLIRETFGQLQEMATNPACFEAELNDVKVNMIKEMKLEQQKNSFWSAFIRNSIFNNETDWNFVSDYENIINRMDAKQLAASIQRDFLDRNVIQSVLYPAEDKGLHTNK